MIILKKCKFNIIDISVIVLVLILILATVVKFGNYNKTNDETAKIDTIDYKIKISKDSNSVYNYLVSLINC